MNAAWLRRTVAYLDWILGDTPTSPLSRQHLPLDPVETLAHPEPDYAVADLIAMGGAGCGVANIEEEMMVYLDTIIMQGHEGQPSAEPGRYRRPSGGRRPASPRLGNRRGQQASGRPPRLRWLHPCPGERRCLREASGRCLGGPIPGMHQPDPATLHRRSPSPATEISPRPGSRSMRWRNRSPSGSRTRPRADVTSMAQLRNVVGSVGSPALPSAGSGADRYAD
jgi:hypothetical protein